MIPTTALSDTKELFVDGNGINVSIYQWANLDGVSIFILGDGENMPNRGALSLRYEELDTLIMALTAARSGF